MSQTGNIDVTLEIETYITPWSGKTYSTIRAGRISIGEEHSNYGKYEKVSALSL
jgi:hypothetical protein